MGACRVAGEGRRPTARVVPRESVDWRAMRPSTRQDWLAAAALLAGLFACLAMPPATTGHNAALAVAALAIGALVALAVARRPFTFAPRIRAAFALLVLLAIWYVATRAWAINPAGSMVESSRVSAFVLLAWASHTTVVGTAARRLLLGGIATAAALVAVPHLIDLLRDGAPQVRVDGELGYWNATAVAALVLVPTAVALAGTGRRALQVLGAVLLPLAGVAAVATASRGALVALVVALLLQAALDPDYRGGLPRALVTAAALAMVIVGLAIDDMPEALSMLAPVAIAVAGFAAIGHRRTRREARLAIAVPPAAGEPPPATRRRLPSAVQLVGGLIVAGVAVLLVTLVLNANSEQLPERDVPSNESVERLATTDDSRRFDWWSEGLDIWKDAPVHGKGGGAFEVLHVDSPADNADHVHSMPLEVLIETGVIGFLLLLGASVQFLRVLRHGRRSTERALAGGIAALLITQGFIDWTLSFPQVLAMLAIAGPLAVQSPPDEPPARAGDEPLWAPIAMLGSLAAATTIALTPTLATLLADQATTAFDDGKPRKAASLSEQSMLLVPSLDTLQVQVLSLQAQGLDSEARGVLSDHEQVWSTSMAGLRLGRDLLADDADLGPRIERRIKQLEDQRARASA